MGDDPRGHREALEEQVPLREAAAARAQLSRGERMWRVVSLGDEKLQYNVRNAGLRPIYK